MGRVICYHPLFDCDVIEAANWYDNRSFGLGNAFASKVKSTVLTIIADPERYAITDFELRYVPVGRFPYFIVVDVSDDAVSFLGVLHTARSIEKWRAERKINGGDSEESEVGEKA